MSEVTVVVDAGVATITMDNASRMNALTRPLLEALGRRIDEIGRHDGVAAVVLTGTGDNFSAGLDVSEITTETSPQVLDEFVQVEEALARCPKPIVAAIRGHCIGGGAQLAIACDLRIAAEGARFAITPAKLGLIYPAPSVERLVRTVGPAATKRLLLTSDTIDTATALRFGLVTDVVAATDFDAEIRRVASTIASRAPATVAAAKQMVDDTATRGGVSDELSCRWTTHPNPDLAIGLAAFADRRTPVFAGPGAAPSAPDSRRV
ncbi:enoyl-CoA hydratase/isomerase family protein [Rhodococcus maanshanensis]|uniref:enoyl-CoA hydratase/isomerase family protein n=1 Tax=Rhodococcus maanshanensis TaxID=183556 RepID=UPI0022B3B6CB|nr:enoyl-CoA hydratase/isomerase family protein [Rhodococcus maanshanensis]MCZ4554441.1 enoyl-CoA hydratase/isomerase family protein [Rhodococcus maanshanensis]